MWFLIDHLGGNVRTGSCKDDVRILNMFLVYVRTGRRVCEQWVRLMAQMTVETWGGREAGTVCLPPKRLSELGMSGKRSQHFLVVLVEGEAALLFIAKTYSCWKLTFAEWNYCEEINFFRMDSSIRFLTGVYTSFSVAQHDVTHHPAYQPELLSSRTVSRWAAGSRFICERNADVMPLYPRRERVCLCPQHEDHLSN
jgi:hypothetical protein